MESVGAAEDGADALILKVPYAVEHNCNNSNNVYHNSEKFYEWMLVDIYYSKTRRVAIIFA